MQVRTFSEINFPQRWSRWLPTMTSRNEHVVRQRLSEKGIRDIAGFLLAAICRCNLTIYDWFMTIIERLPSGLITSLDIENKFVVEILEALEANDIAQAEKLIIETPRVNVTPPPVAPPTPPKIEIVSTDPISRTIKFLQGEDPYLKVIRDNPKATMEKVFHSLDHAMKRLETLGFCVALYRTVREGERVLLHLTQATTSYGESMFRQPAVPDPQTSTVGWVYSQGKENDPYVVNINDPETFTQQGIPFFPKRAAVDAIETSGSPGTTMIMKLCSSYGVEAIVQIHGRHLAGAQLNEKQRAIADLFADQPTEAIREQRDQVLFLLRTYFTGQVVPTIEAVKERLPVIAEKQPDPDELSGRLFATVSRKCVLRRYGIFSVARVSSPASNLSSEEKRLIADALNWQRRSRADMIAHIANINELIIVFLEGKPVTFYAGQELDFNNDGRLEKMLVITGVMNRPDLHGYRIQAFVTGLSMLRAWLRHKLLGGWAGFFRAPLVIMRTRTEWTAADFIDFFGAVKWQKLTGGDLARAREFARYMGQECDDDGVFRNAYSQPLGDPEKGKVFMERLAQRNPQLHQKLTAAFVNLSPLDCRIFQGVLTLRAVLKFLIYTQVIFPRQNRKPREQAVQAAA
jgi:hypothetical protein